MPEWKRPQLGSSSETRKESHSAECGIDWEAEVWTLALRMALPIIHLHPSPREGAFGHIFPHLSAWQPLIFSVLWSPCLDRSSFLVWCFHSKAVMMTERKRPTDAAKRKFPEWPWLQKLKKTVRQSRKQYRVLPAGFTDFSRSPSCSFAKHETLLLCHFHRELPNLPLASFSGDSAIAVSVLHCKPWMPTTPAHSRVLTGQLDEVKANFPWIASCSGPRFQGCFCTVYLYTWCFHVVNTCTLPPQMTGLWVSDSHPWEGPLLLHYRGTRGVHSHIL